jgi:hypothetical protein
MITRAPTQGGCLCGAVRYEVDGPFNTMVHCHCSMCRKHHGAAFATFVGAPLMGFRWHAGERNVVIYQSSEHGYRPSCRTCGSVTPTLVKEMDLVLLPAGNLQGDLDISPQAHIFVGSKAPWYPITDSLPQHEEYPPEFAMGSVSRAPIDWPLDAIAGSCLCGGVAYQIANPPRMMRNCHCSRCRRGRSAAHATNALYALEDFTFVRGEAQVVEYRVPEAMYFATAFCRHCGSATPRFSRERGLAIVPAGTLDTDPGARPTEHIFVSSKANWFDISDDLPQFDAAKPA